MTRVDVPIPTNWLATVATLTGVALAIAQPAAAEWVEWIGDAEFQTTFNDNLNQTGFDAQEASDFVFTPRVSAGRVYQLGDQTRLSGTIDLEGRLHARFDRLNAALYGVTVAAHHKLGLGPTKPWMRLHASGKRFDLKEHGRDSWLLDSGLEIGRRFSPRFDASIAYAYEVREGKSGRAAVPGFNDNVWDQSRHRVTAQANFLATDLLMLSGGLEYLDGDFQSSCPSVNSAGGGIGPMPGPPGPGPAGGGGLLVREKPQAVALDEVFGNDPGDCIYRIDGTIYAAFLGVNYPVTDRTTLDLGYRFQHGEGRFLHYQSHISTLTFSFRY